MGVCVCLLVEKGQTYANIITPIKSTEGPWRGASGEGEWQQLCAIAGVCASNWWNLFFSAWVCVDADVWVLTFWQHSPPFPPPSAPPSLPPSRSLPPHICLSSGSRRSSKARLGRDSVFGGERNEDMGRLNVGARTDEKQAERASPGANQCFLDAMTVCDRL